MRTGHWQLGNRRVIAAAVLGAHLLLLWFMQRQLLHSPARPTVNATRLRMEMWLTPPTAALPRLPSRASALPEQAPQSDGRAGSAARSAPSARRSLSTPATQPAIGDPTTAFASAPAAAESASAPTRDAPADTTPLLDTAATRRAIHESALGGGSLAQQAVEEGAALRSPTATARLPGAMERSGKGDCAKGDFAGGGMGLLSLPFLAAAAIKGDCAK